MGDVLTPARIAEIKGQTPSDVEVLELNAMNLGAVDAVACCHRLSKLVLDGNMLRSLNGVEELPNLQTLSVQYNKLTSLEDLRGLPRLAVLNVSHNELKTLGTVPRNLVGLRAIIVTDNGLRALYLHLYSKLEELTTIVASRNAIEEVAGADKLPRLRKLSLSQNSLRTLGALPGALTELRLNNNKLAVLPPSLEVCARLTLLDVGCNQLRTTEQLSSLSSLPSLRQLNVKGNPFCADDGSHCFAVARMLPRIKVLDGRKSHGPRKTRFESSPTETATVGQVQARHHPAGPTSPGDAGKKEQQHKRSAGADGTTHRGNGQARGESAPAHGKRPKKDKAVMLEPNGPTSATDDERASQRPLETTGSEPTGIVAVEQKRMATSDHLVQVVADSDCLAAWADAERDAFRAW